jgi:hypothetical protein
VLDGIAIVYFCRFKKKTSRFQNEKAFHDNVYVILLRDGVVKHPLSKKKRHRAAKK